MSGLDQSFNNPLLCDALSLDVKYDKGVIRRMSCVEQDLLALLEYPTSLPNFGGARAVSPYFLCLFFVYHCMSVCI